MYVKMQHTDTIGMVIAVPAWIAMQIFLKLHYMSLAEYSSLCVMLGVAWTFIANADKAVANIKRFNEFIKSLKKK